MIPLTQRFLRPEREREREEIEREFKKWKKEKKRKETKKSIPVRVQRVSFSLPTMANLSVEHESHPSKKNFKIFKKERDKERKKRLLFGAIFENIFINLLVFLMGKFNNNS